MRNGRIYFLTFLLTSFYLRPCRPLVRCHGGLQHYYIGPGEETSIGDSGCSEYTVSISTSSGTPSGRKKTYALDALDGGHSYNIFWKGRYWDIGEDVD
ncbi:MAG: hypothetical protein CBARDCOR_6895 [uncultured Caballeronia sp.]|nr:MAG: hypothetical protein CBARDCOR_6895 [uncultured Caballeronia sp.]